MKKKTDIERYADFFFEVGTLRKLMRMHRQALLTDDLSDNIASHTFRVAIIAWYIAKEENLDPYVTVMMALLHDLGETRTNDHNWIHKRYVRTYSDEVLTDQFQSLPHTELGMFANAYEKRESAEAYAVKDADLLDQILLLREYEWQGNKEASIWLTGKDGSEVRQGTLLHFESSKRMCKAIYTRNPSDWWSELWTPDNR